MTKKSFNKAALSLWLVGACWMGTGCETIVEVDIPEHEPSLVANSLFNPDSSWEVKLFRSIGSLSHIPQQPVTNGQVEIIDGNEQVIATLSHVRDGVYRASANIRPTAGERYGLRGSASGFAPIEAWDEVPMPVAIEAIDIRTNSIPFKITIEFTDPVSTKNYYQILALTPEFDGSNRLLPIWLESDDLIFQDIGGIGRDEALFDDSLISGQRYSLSVRVFPWQTEPLRQIYIVLLSVTESYFKYTRSVVTQADNGDNPFSTPVQIFNNVENGLGIFAGFSGMKMPVFPEAPELPILPPGETP